MNQPSVAGLAEPFNTPADTVAWQRLPTRARALLLFVWVTESSVIGLVAGAVHAFMNDASMPELIAGVAVGGIIAGAFGMWMALKEYRYTFWRLDDEGLALRRGKFWQTEIRVPATRVQHLDLKRGPLQRRRRLATLVVHTAGTKDSAVSVPHLDSDDAERLRDRLGRQIDHDDDA